MGPVQSFGATLQQHIDTIRRTAFASPAGGGPEWDGLLRHYGHTPIDPQERSMIVSCMRLARGATPAELRMVFAGLAQWANGELSRIAASGGANDPAFASLRDQVARLVDTETAAYERALGIPPPAPAGPAPIVAAAAPAGPSLGSIFANASATSKEVPWAGQTYKNVVNLNCVHCGGPQEQPSDFMCKYCRRPIAGSIKPTA